MFDMFAQIFAHGLQDSPVWSEIRTWFEHLIQHAPKRWTMSAIGGQQCECGRVAMGLCVACKRPTCLGHSMISASAEMMCFDCVHQAVGHKRAEAPPPRWPRNETQKQVQDERTRYLKVLGLKPGASMDEIKTSWKRLAVKHHPDRAKPERRQAAEKKMRTINEAYQWLTKNASAEAA